MGWWVTRSEIAFSDRMQPATLEHFCEIFDCREQRCFENPILSIRLLFEWLDAVVINNGWIKFKPKGTFRSSLRTSLYHETWHFSRLSWTELAHLFWHLFSWSHQWLKSLRAWSFFLLVNQYYLQIVILICISWTLLSWLLHAFPRQHLLIPVFSFCIDSSIFLITDQDIYLVIIFYAWSLSSL